MSRIEFALLQFNEVTAAEKAYADARDRSARDSPWIREVGLVEHHPNGHWVLRGTFAGHYLDVDQALHVSERGGAEGFAAGAALGALLGPPGLAAGMVLGAIIALADRATGRTRTRATPARRPIARASGAPRLSNITHRRYARRGRHADGGRTDPRTHHARVSHRDRGRVTRALPEFHAGRVARANGEGRGGNRGNR
jgi:hypothetical protein